MQSENTYNHRAPSEGPLLYANYGPIWKHLSHTALSRGGELTFMGHSLWSSPHGRRLSFLLIPITILGYLKFTHSFVR